MGHGLVRNYGIVSKINALLSQVANNTMDYSGNRASAPR
jgi:hypothetical protein